MKHLILLLLIVIQQYNTQASESENQVVPQTQEYNKHFGSFVEGTQPGSQPELQSQGSLGQPLVPNLPRKESDKEINPAQQDGQREEDNHPQLIRR